MARRSAGLVRLLRALGVLLVLVLGTQACGTIDELLQLEQRIERQGYRVSNVFHDDFGTGSNEVQVEAESNRGLEPPEGQDEIAGIVWNSYPRRFTTVAVTLDGDLALYTRGELQERFGPRDPQLDEKAFSDDINGAVRNGAIVALIVLALGVLLVVLLVRASRKRRRNQPPPPPFGPPPGMPPPGMPPPGMPPPPPPGPPPGWRPPSSGYPPPGPR